MDFIFFTYQESHSLSTEVAWKITEGRGAEGLLRTEALFLLIEGYRRAVCLQLAEG
jgi:hypothetical protein